MSVIGKGVTLRGFTFEDFSFTVLLSGSPVVGTDEGKAVSIDTSAANTFKLAADGDEIWGKLVSIESRTQEGLTVGAVEFKFATAFSPKVGYTPAVGHRVVGGGAGTIKQDAGTPPASAIFPRVVEVLADGRAVVVKF